MLSTIIGAILTLIIGIVFNKLLWTVIFYISFASLRSQCGGYHASTLIKCKIVFGTIVILNILLSGLTQNISAFFSIPLILVDFIVMIKYSPSENENKIMDNADIKKHKLIGIAVFCFWTLLSILFYFVVPELFWVINWSIFSVSALILYNCIRRIKT